MGSMHQTCPHSNSQCYMHSWTSFNHLNICNKQIAASFTDETGLLCNNRVPLPEDEKSSQLSSSIQVSAKRRPVVLAWALVIGKTQKCEGHICQYVQVIGQSIKILEETEGTLLIGRLLCELWARVIITINNRMLELLIAVIHNWITDF